MSSLEGGVKSGYILPAVWPDPRPTGQDLYAFREKMGMTQRQAAEWFNLTQSTVWRWEKKGHKFLLPQAAMAREIDDFMRMPMKDLKRFYHARD